MEYFVCDVGVPRPVSATKKESSWLRGYLNHIKAKYDAAQTTPDNERYWANADYLGPNAAHDKAVRQKIRSRARYEISESNSYAKGMVLKAAGYVIGPGPRLQVNTTDKKLNSLVETSFRQWAREVKLGMKLRCGYTAKKIDGESFIEKITNEALRHPVKLDLLVQESDIYTNPEASFDYYEADGKVFDEIGRPVKYRKLVTHPGEAKFTDPFDYEDLFAEQVIHWYRIDRPNQQRGVSELAPALPLFAELRRFIFATVAAAETAANHAGIMYSDASAFGEDPDEITEDFMRVELERRALLTMPAGWKMAQLRAEHPTTTFAEFEKRLLMNIAACWCMPYNIASGNSGESNFSSAKLDYLLWHEQCSIERDEAELVVLDDTLRSWFEEYSELPESATRGMSLSDLPYRWFWQPFPLLDPVEHQKASEMAWQRGHLTDEMYLSELGIDPDEHYEQLKRQTEARKSLDKQFPQPGGFTEIQNGAENQDQGGAGGGQNPVQRPKPNNRSGGGEPT